MGENDECMRTAAREADRDPCLGVIVSTSMMKQPSSPPCHDGKSSVWLGSTFRGIHPLIPSICRERIQKAFSVLPL